MWSSWLLFQNLILISFRLTIAILITIVRTLPISLAIKLYSSMSSSAGKFEAQNSKPNKENVRPDVTQIIMAEKVDQIF